MLPPYGRRALRDRALSSAAWIQVSAGHTTRLSRNIAGGTEASLITITIGTMQSTAVVVYAAPTPSRHAMIIFMAVIRLAPWWVTTERATRSVSLQEQDGSDAAT